MANWRCLGLFFLLSCGDFALTASLLKNSGGRVYESNPLANWMLRELGWLGLAGYKSASVFLVGGLALVISHYRPRTAGRLLKFSCLTVAGVLLYSGTLLALDRQPPGKEDAKQVAAKALRLEQQIRNAHYYRFLLERLSRNLVEHRCTLAEAAQALADSAQAQDPEWQTQLQRIFPGHSGRRLLAAHLLRYTVLDHRDNPKLMRRVARQLKKAFRADFGVDPPPLALKTDVVRSDWTFPPSRSGYWCPVAGVVSRLTRAPGHFPARKSLSRHELVRLFAPCLTAA
jgi:hypothetical protein